MFLRISWVAQADMIFVFAVYCTAALMLVISTISGGDEHDKYNKIYEMKKTWKYQYN